MITFLVIHITRTADQNRQMLRPSETIRSMDQTFCRTKLTPIEQQLGPIINPTLEMQIQKSDQTIEMLTLN